jgi:hypothetical protein
VPSGNGGAATAAAIAAAAFSATAAGDGPNPHRTVHCYEKQPFDAAAGVTSKRRRSSVDVDERLSKDRAARAAADEVMVQRAAAEGGAGRAAAQPPPLPPPPPPPRPDGAVAATATPFLHFVRCAGHAACARGRHWPRAEVSRRLTAAWTALEPAARQRWRWAPCGKGEQCRCVPASASFERTLSPDVCGPSRARVGPSLSVPFPPDDWRGGFGSPSALRVRLRVTQTGPSAELLSG